MHSQNKQWDAWQHTTVKYFRLNTSLLALRAGGQRRTFKRELFGPTDFKLWCSRLSFNLLFFLFPQDLYLISVIRMCHSYQNYESGSCNFMKSKDFIIFCVLFYLFRFDQIQALSLSRYKINKSNHWDKLNPCFLMFKKPYKNKTCYK